MGRKAKASEPESPVRDREQTKERIVAAAASLVAREGFQGLGVNALAKEAGVDKVLIYRYFGDLAGLLEELGSRTDLWLAGAERAVPGGPDYASFSSSLLLEYARALRASPLLQRLLAWELVAEDETIRSVGKARSEAVSAWFRALGAGIEPPPTGVDVGAVNAILIAAVHHLALRESSAGEFTGMNMKDPKTWARIEATLGIMIERMLGVESAPKSVPRPKSEPTKAAGRKRSAGGKRAGQP